MNRIQNTKLRYVMILIFATVIGFLFPYLIRRLDRFMQSLFYTVIIAIFLFRYAGEPWRMSLIKGISVGLVGWGIVMGVIIGMSIFFGGWR